MTERQKMGSNNDNRLHPSQSEVSNTAMCEVAITTNSSGRRPKRRRTASTGLQLQAEDEDLNTTVNTGERLSSLPPAPQAPSVETAGWPGINQLMNMYVASLGDSSAAVQQPAASLSNFALPQQAAAFLGLQTNGPATENPPAASSLGFSRIIQLPQNVGMTVGSSMPQHFPQQQQQQQEQQQSQHSHAGIVDQQLAASFQHQILRALGFPASTVPLLAQSLGLSSSSLQQPLQNAAEVASASRQVFPASTAPSNNANENQHGSSVNPLANATVQTLQNLINNASENQQLTHNPLAFTTVQSLQNLINTAIISQQYNNIANVAHSTTTTTASSAMPDNSSFFGPNLQGVLLGQSPAHGLSFSSVTNSSHLLQSSSHGASLSDNNGTVHSTSIGSSRPSNTNSDEFLTGRPPVVLYISCDDESLSDYQCLARKQIELFEADREDVESNAQGRNRPIVMGQVGIRCRHCTMLPPKHRARGGIYYPAKLNGIYQAAQNMASSHLCEHCQHVPEPIRSDLVKFRDRKSSAGGGKKYWADGVRVLGVFEDINGLRFKPL